MPPFSRPSDYTKAAITQDEYLRIAIANDANIAAARKAVKMGEVLQLSSIQDATADELLLDMGKQETEARSNLIRLGFKDLDAQTITANLINEPDVMRMFNMSFPSILIDIKKRFNPKLITTSFFLEYLREYASNMNASKGLDANSSGAVKQGLNALINSIAEIRMILPEQGQMTTLLRNVDRIRRQTGRTDLLDPILERLQVLQNALPSSVDYAEIERLNDVSKFQIIQALADATDTLPTKSEVDVILKMVESGNKDALQKIKDLAISVPNNLQRRLDTILADVRETGALQTQTLRKIEQVQQQGTPSKRKQEWEGNYPIDFDSFISLKIIDKRQYLKAAITNGDLNYTKTQINDSSEANLIDIYKSNLEPSVVGLSAIRKEPSMPMSAATSKAGDTETISGLGIRKLVPLKRIKLGKGISVQEQPTYKEYGKYAVHMTQLEEQDILNVKYKSLGGIPKFKPFPISDIFRDFMLDVLDGKRPSERVYLQIDANERKAFEEISIGAGVWSSFGLKRTTTNDDEEDRKRFEVLKGIYTAGNNSPQVSQELRRLVTKFINEGKMKRQQGLRLLMELSI